jgi:hypothetical protein
MPDVTLQVYPLKADNEKLSKLVSNYFFESLNFVADDGTSKSLGVKSIGNYVYLIVRVVGDEYGKVWSPTRNVEWWHDKSVQLCVPVEYSLDNNPIGTAFFPVYVFANSGRATISDREVNGRPTLKATIESPPDVWLNPSGPVQPRHFLRLSTEVFKTFGEGEQVTEQTLIEIDALNLPDKSDTNEWLEILNDKLPTMLEDGKQQSDESQQRHLSLSQFPIDTDIPLNSLTLKQYRDAQHTTSACYQAVIATGVSVKRIYDSRAITEPVCIRLHRFPSLPIVDILGLEVEHVDTTNEREVIQVLKPLHPFWIRVSIQEDLGKVIAAWSDKSKSWVLDSDFPPSVDRDQANHEIPNAKENLQKVIEYFSSMARANGQNDEAQDEITIKINGNKILRIPAHEFGPLQPLLVHFNRESSPTGSFRSIAEFYSKFQDYCNNNRDK